ncbi:uncharacterized protein N7482_007903 [Penicillium canariense]|uniref:Uncharacterized protein n=1 Tax=Penicillium canariense TaxID=189055 RepID=A0A9W9HZ01_9EURO|nr:uncharacterized protein N7482_007903 [Penicillium canariense]KAJ5160899.1 hypothetical protein N7482_007903 [Penicillium canariense]
MQGNMLIALLVGILLTIIIFGWLVICWYRRHVNTGIRMSQARARLNRDRRTSTWDVERGQGPGGLVPKYSRIGWVRLKPKFGTILKEPDYVVLRRVEGAASPYRAALVRNWHASPADAESQGRNSRITHQNQQSRHQENTQKQKLRQTQKQKQRKRNQGSQGQPGNNQPNGNNNKPAKTTGWSEHEDPGQTSHHSGGDQQNDHTHKADAWTDRNEASGSKKSKKSGHNRDNRGSNKNSWHIQSGQANWSNHSKTGENHTHDGGRGSARERGASHNDSKQSEHPPQKDRGDEESQHHSNRKARSPSPGKSNNVHNTGEGGEEPSGWNGHNPAGRTSPAGDWADGPTVKW